MDKTVEVQATIVSVLRSNIQLSELGIIGVYNPPPEDARMPYISFGDISVFPMPAKGVDWKRYTVTLHVWTEDDGPIRNHQIQSKLNDLFHDQTFVLTNNEKIDAYHLSSNTLNDPDGITKHGVVRIEFYG